MDVLDVHHNRITSAAPLSHLTSLRILNLSSNCLSSLSDLSPLRALAELNVRRNSLTSLHFTGVWGSVDQPHEDGATNENDAGSDVDQDGEGSCHHTDTSHHTHQSACSSRQNTEMPEGTARQLFQQVWLLAFLKVPILIHQSHPSSPPHHRGGTWSSS